MQRILIIALIALSSCKVKKSVSTVNLRHDTVFKSIVVKSEVHDTSYISNPCDSNGILKAFNQTVVSEGLVVKVSNDSGRIKTVILRKTDTIFKEKVVSDKALSKTEYKEVVKYRIPKWVFILLAINVIFVAFWVRKWIK